VKGNIPLWLAVMPIITIPMKITSLKKTIGLLTLSAMFVVPAFASAADVETKGSVHINDSGIIHVLGAQVTSISGNIVSAVSNFKNTMLNWTVTTNASTTIAGSASSTLTDIHIGDKINLTGVLNSFGATSLITATKLHDVTTSASTTAKARTGTVQSINTSNGTFVLKSDDKTITVQTNASTTFTLGSGNTIAATTLANLPLNAMVSVHGILSADKATMVASKVVVFLGAHKPKEDKDTTHTNKGEHKGLKLGWMLGIGNSHR
jgi:hypothetical protein